MKKTFLLAALVMMLLVSGCTSPSASVLTKTPIKELPCSSLEQCTQQYKDSGYPDSYIANLGIYCTEGRCYVK